MTASERRTENRSVVSRYYSVQFYLPEMRTTYQFRLWDISRNGLCVIVEAGSEILDHLRVGDRLNVKYFPSDLMGSAEIRKTELRHITYVGKGRFRGYAMVGLLIVEAEAD